MLLMVITMRQTVISEVQILVTGYSYINGGKSEYKYYIQNAHGDVVNIIKENGKIYRKI